MHNSLQNFSQPQLASKAYELINEKKFPEAIEVLKLALRMGPGQAAVDLSLYCNALYVLQQDNTGLPVDEKLNHEFLGKCLPFGPQNPAIYFNAACVYMEMNDLDNVAECIRLAKHYQYADYEGMLKEIKNAPMFAAFVKDSRFSAIFTNGDKKYEIK